MRRFPSRLSDFALLAAILAPMGSLTAQTLNVPGDHGSIQAAVDAATPGTTIVVTGGHWTEAVVIDTPGLTLVGQGALLDPEYEGDGFTIRAADTTIRSFEIVNASVGILAEPGEVEGVEVPFGGVVLVDNTIEATDDLGIFLQVQSAQLRGNKLFACDEGIAIEGLAPATDFVLLRNHIESASRGVTIEAISATLHHNTVIGMAEYGMDLEFSPDNYSGVADPPAVSLVGNLVRNCGGDGNDGNGVVLDLDGVDAVVRKNRILDNGYDGLEISAGASDWVVVSDNLLTGNLSESMDLYLSGIVERNRVRENKHGMWVGAPTGGAITVDRNLVQSNWGDGISIGGYGQATVVDNRVRDNSEDGIKANWEQTPVTIAGNRVTGNGHQGISNDAVGAVITDNICSGNGGLLGPDLAGAGDGTGTVSSWSGNVGLGGPEEPDRL